MATFDFDIGSEIFCEEKSCGRLRKVVVDPHTHRVIDLVMERGGLLGKDRILPVRLVDRATREHIYLSISRDDLASYPEYREVEFRKPAPEVERYGASQVECYWSGYGQVCTNPVVPMVRQRIHQGISAGEEPIERNTEVRNLDETLGRVDHLLVDPESGEITYLVMRTGIIRHYPVIPISAVRSVSDEAIVVSLSKDEVNALPMYRPRDSQDIESELADRLAKDPMDFDQVEVAADGGTVNLVGWVPSMSAKRHAEAIARSVDGVIDVDNEIECSESVQTHVLHALLSDPRTSLETIEVIEDRGVVTLKGTVGDPEVRRAAEEIAARQRGVLSVSNALEAVPDDDTPVLRPRLLGEGLLGYKGGLGNPPTVQF